MTTLKTVDEIDAEDDIISLNKNEQISIHRSDGIKHDLVSVFSKTGISNVVDESVRLANENKSKTNHVDSKTININRSDGKHHDINAVLRSFSEKELISDSQKKQSLWTKLAPKISFSATQYQQPEKNRATASSKDYSLYHPTVVRIVHMSDTFNFLKPTSKQKFLPGINVCFQICLM